MTLRDDLRGVRRVDLASAVLLIPTLALGAYVITQDAQDAQDAGETQVQETPVQDAGAEYAKTWEWCNDRFPYRTDLQEACQWGAYEMLPGPDSIPAIPNYPNTAHLKGTKDA